MAAAAGFIAGNAIYPDMEIGAAYDEAMQAYVFGPLGMTNATFDIDVVEQGNHARPYGYDVDGNPVVARMDLNYSVGPLRPAGGLWTSARDLMRYVQLELSRGKLPDGTQLVSENNLFARRAKQVAVGETAVYGMGLFVDSHWDVTVISHGGSMSGYKSNMWMLPEYGVGAVILTNADTGWLMFEPFGRRLLEVLFDGRPEAQADLLAGTREWETWIAKERERLVVPADSAMGANLATRYRNPALGEIVVRKSGAETVFDFGEWKSVVASRENDDGSVSFRTIDPGMDGFEFVVVGNTLVLRDLQHEYVFTPE
jgi:CubicO group peptidase (beta-lactamase class C family)